MTGDYAIKTGKEIGEQMDEIQTYNLRYVSLLEQRWWLCSDFERELDEMLRLCYTDLPELKHRIIKLADACKSKEIVYGHRIPHVSPCKACGEKPKGEEKK